MKQKTERSTIGYEPEAVTKEVNISFTKITRAANVIISGEIAKGEEKVGRVDLNKADDTITVSIKPASRLNDAENTALFKKIPECLKEIIADN